MQVLANGFSRLKVLQLLKLKRLTKLNIGQGVMSWLTQLQILSKVQISGFKGLLNLLELNFMILSIFSLAWFSRIKGVISTHKLLPWILQGTCIHRSILNPLSY